MVDLFDPILCPHKDTLNILIKNHRHSVMSSSHMNSQPPCLWTLKWVQCTVVSIFLTWLTPLGLAPQWIKVMLLCPITLSSPRKLDLFVYLHNNMWFSIYGTGYIYEMYCAGPFLKFLVHDMPTFTKKCLIWAWTHWAKRSTCLGQLEAQLKKKLAVGQSCYNVNCSLR